MAKLKPGSYPLTRGGMSSARKATTSMRKNMGANKSGKYGSLINKQIPSNKQIPDSPGISPMRPEDNEIQDFRNNPNWMELKPGETPRSDGSNTNPNPFLHASGKPSTFGQGDPGGDTVTPGFKRGGPKIKPPYVAPDPNDGQTNPGVPKGTYSKDGDPSIAPMSRPGGKSNFKKYRG